jgi:PncC family amidohydrolase
VTHGLAGLDEARVVHRLLAAAGATVATAESLTGGLVGAVLTAVPGASATYRGGVIAYASDLKAGMLGVPPALLAAHGAVHPDVATAMADGVRRRTGATYGLATTGVAGPDPQDGQPVGLVYVAVAGPDGAEVVTLQPAGASDRARIRAAAVQAALSLLRGTLENAGRG